MKGTVIMSGFVCPLCHGDLARVGTSLKCAAGHCYDVAKEGYVHLLPQNKMNSKSPGDSKEMLLSRRSFLNKGYYEPLRDCICNICKKVCCDNAVFLDCGCGEGYYTEKMAETLQGKLSAALGIDISKAAVSLAARYHSSVLYAVASVYDMPISDASVDIAVDVFSPLALDELRRVLKGGGHFIYAVPSPRHLWQIKSAVYEKPYENHPQRPEYEGFELKDVRELRYEKVFETSDDIISCFSMTPYYWRSPKESTEKLARLSELSCEIGFDVLVYRKK